MKRRRSKKVSVIARMPVEILTAVCGLCLIGIAPDARPNTQMNPTVVEAEVNRKAGTSRPILVIEREEIERAGRRTLGEFLQRLPMHGSASNALFTTGGDGGLRLDLRDLGPQRTLVVLDDHRFIPTIDGSFDVTLLPLSAVERIEILSGAAALAYGSGAVSGVIRITLRTTSASDEVAVGYGQTDERDGAEMFGSAVLSRSQAGRSYLASFSYHEAEPIEAGARAISSTPVHGFPAEVTTPNGAPSPWGVFYLGRGSFVTLDHDSAGCRPDQQCSRYTPGFRPIDVARDGYNTQQYKYLKTPHRQRAALLKISDAADDYAGSIVLMVSERDSERRRALDPIRRSPSPSSVYYPFEGPILSTRYQPEGRYSFDRDDVDTAFVAANIERALAQWEVGARFTIGRVEQKETHHGVYDGNRLAAALGASFIDADGRARCGTPQAVVDDCVPLNLFGGPSGLTSAMLDGILTTSRDDGHYSMVEFSSEARRPIALLREGSLTLSSRSRAESGRGNPSPYVVFGQNAISFNDLLHGWMVRRPLEARATTFEASALLAGEPFERVRFELGVGAVNSSVGGSDHIAGLELNWKPSDSLTLITRFAGAPRTPAVSEIATPIWALPSDEGDPCSLPDALVAPVVTERCRTGIGSQPPLPEKPPRPQSALVTYGGSDALKNEAATSASVGLSFTPAAIPGLSVQADWYRITIDNPISADRPIEILNNCYASGVLADCDRFTRDEDGVIDTIDARIRNVETGLQVEGFDLSARHDTTFAGGVTLNVAGTVSHLTYFGDASSSASSPVSFTNSRPRVNRAGTYVNRETALPKWKAFTRADVTWDRVTFSVAGRYLSSMLEDCDRLYVLSMGTRCSVDAEAGLSNRIGSAWYLDAELSMRFGDNVDVGLGMDNVTGRSPPVAPTSIENSFDPGQEVPGRFYYLSANWRF